MNLITRLFALLLSLAAATAFAAPVDASETLDGLMAKRLSADTTFVNLVEPRTLRLRGTVDSLPAPGKTQYMADTLALRGIKPLPKVSHKMWLRSAGGARVMVYVADNVAERLKREAKPGTELDFIALHLWNSRHGPGLLVNDYVRTGLTLDKLKPALVRWFGGDPGPERAR